MFWKRSYCYYVVYSFLNKVGSGFGSFTISNDKPITKYEQIEALKKTIAEKESLEKVIILSYSRIRG